MSVLKRAWKKIKKWTLILLAAHLVYLIVLKWVFPPITMIQLFSWIEGHGLKRTYVEIKDIAPPMRLAVIAAEDQLFMEHQGFDWKSIEKAFTHNQKKPNRIRGASTISQQVAKNVFLWNGRSWIRKGLEVYFTFMIEVFWGKERILEVYLNVAETGKGVFGVEEAAQQYFNKPAKKLNRHQAALIAASLPNPKKYTIKPPSSRVRSRAAWIENQMHNLAADQQLEAVLQ